MARIQPLTGRSAPLILKALNVFTRLSMGKQLAPLAILAHNPRFLLPFALSSELNAGKSRVDGRIRALATELATHLNGCSWCADYGRGVAIERGVPLEKLDAVEAYATSPLFTPAERAALALAEAMTRNVRVSDPVWDEAARYFSQRELVELVVAVSIQCFYTHVNVALGIESQGFCELPALARSAGPTRP